MIHHPCLKSFPTYPTLQSAHGHKFQPLPGPRLESLIHTGRGKDGMLILWKPDAFGRVVMVVVVRVVLVAGVVVILVVVVVAHVGSEELLPSSDLVCNLRTLGVTLDINT